MSALGTDEAFVGLRYNDSMTPAGWYWETPNNYIAVKINKIGYGWVHPHIAICSVSNECF